MKPKTPLAATAAAHGQVLVTLDKDSGELAVLYRRPHAYDARERSLHYLLYCAPDIPVNVSFCMPAPVAAT